MEVKFHNIHYIELWVDDARAVADAYHRAFGLNAIAEAGPETGLAGHRSVVLAQGEARLVVTSSLDGQGPVAEFTRLHGDGVRDIAFRVDHPALAFDEAVARGAEPIDTPSIPGGGVIRTTIRGFGDVVHSFIADSALPRWYRPITSRSISNSQSRVLAIDHVAMCLPTGQLDEVAEFYKRVLDFEDGHKEYVETELSGMNARVVQHGRIKFPLQEPLKHNPSGPIAEFIELNCGPGVYHVGLLTDDICSTMRSVRDKVKALEVPASYYDQLPNRVGSLDEPLADLRELEILVDRDRAGYLLQTFTRSLHRRQTFFIEIIQRKGDVLGFGSANIRALFDAVEADRLALGATLATQTGKMSMPPRKQARA